MAKLNQESLLIWEGNAIQAFNKGNGSWHLHRTPIHVYPFNTFHENPEFCKYTKEITSAGCKPNQVEDFGIDLGYVWFRKWMELGGKREGSPREIKMMVWMLDPKSNIPTPYPVVTCSELFLWDTSAREALFAADLPNQNLIKGLWYYESPPMNFSTLAINDIIKNNIGTIEFFESEEGKELGYLPIRK
jgi:hypothetical protein